MKKSRIEAKRQIPQQLSFDPPVFNFTRKNLEYNVNADEEKQKQEEANQRSFQDNSDNFSAEQRESLKNAFRYICRLMFKQAHKYKQKIVEIAQQNQLTLQTDQQFKKMFDKAEQISGERYFRKYVQNFDQNERKTICGYMKWFLINKYLRYISEQGKGKRKMMKKHLYIKFKNEVMLPYIESLI